MGNYFSIHMPSFKFNNFFSNHFIRLFCRRLGLPRRQIYNLVRALSFVSPDSFEEKHVINSGHSNAGNCPVDKELGYFLFDENQTSELESVVADCMELYHQKHRQYDADYFLKNPNKRFLLTLASDHELMKITSIHEFITSDFVINTVYSYLQQPFVLSTIRLWWTVVNDTEIRSQKFHLDDEDLTQIKLFVNISDVSEDHGPFRFIDADNSQKIIASYRHGKRRFGDDEISAAMDEAPVISLTGSAGEGGFIDTSRCLHFGSRENKHDRLVLMAQFLKYDAPLLRGSLPVYAQPASYLSGEIPKSKN